MDLEIALEFVNQTLINKAGRNLRPPETTVFRGTWQGATYEQMAATSAYSANYLMRDIAPKFWKLLSKVFDRNISKSNLRVQLNRMYDLSRVELANETQVNSELNINNYHDWLNSNTFASVFYGRTDELNTIQQWVVDDRARLIEIWGLSGTGKTLLMKKIGEQIQDRYEIVIWRSLATAPSLTVLISDLLQSGFGIIEKNHDRLSSEFITRIKSRPSLIMLDGIEAILQPKTFSGKYKAGYEDYAEFFQAIAQSCCQSCVIVTSDENFSIATQLSSKDSAIRNLKLSGLSQSAARSLLNQRASISDIPQRLIEYYQGNPAILIAAAGIIRELFNGNTKEFLAQKSLVFGEIARLLSKPWDRLSSLETEILYWLASETQPMSLSEIQEGIPLSIYPVELLEALESLIGRSLIETTQVEQRSVFTLLPAIRQLAIERFVAQVGDNFSLANRQNSSSSENTIALGKTTQVTHLSQWLQHRFEFGWRPIETLFTASERSPTRLRSAFNLRGEGVIKRFKQINLSTDNSAVLLLVAISQEDTAFKICVQAQPALSQQALPNNLELSLIDTSDTVLATIISQTKDNFIQLPYFSGTKNEKFKIGIDLDSASYREEFLI